MCTLVLLRRPGHSWPLLLAANRDEMEGRASLPPGRHWPDRADVVAGLDLEAGGSWLGLNDSGIVAAVLNRTGTLGPAAGKRSRGELVLEALDHADAAAAAQALAAIEPKAYRPFNLVIADARSAFWLRHAGDEPISSQPLPEGLAMLTSRELDDLSSPRIRRYRPLFAQVVTPDPERGDWTDWQLLLASRSSPTGDPRDAMSIATETGYGTRSTSLLALPADPDDDPIWLYAEGSSGELNFVAVPR
jgi:uncharacterized protein with NRDE domain